MAQGIPPICELPALFELETELCSSAIGSHVSDILGGAIS